jgi:hypothetical protein
MSGRGRNAHLAEQAFAESQVKGEGTRMERLGASDAKVDTGFAWKDAFIQIAKASDVGSISRPRR